MFDSFRSLYVKYTDAEPFSGNDMSELRSHIRELRDATVERTDVLVCMPFAASIAPVHQNASPEVVAIDKAARLI